MSEDLPSNEKRNVRLRDRQKEDKKLTDSILRELMGRIDGRRFVWLQLSRANVFSSTITFGEDGDRKTAFNEGMRAHGLALLADVTRVAPQAYLTMTVENSSIKMEGEEDERS